MENMEIYPEEDQSPTAEVKPTNDLYQMETAKLDNGDSSNEETEMEAEDGQQVPEEADTMMAEMDEPEKKHLSMVQKNYSEGDLRIMNEISQLPPPFLADEIVLLEREMFELTQREAREITRSKHLENFGKNKRRFSK